MKLDAPPLQGAHPLNRHRYAQAQEVIEFERFRVFEVDKQPLDAPKLGIHNTEQFLDPIVRRAVWPDHSLELEILVDADVPSTKCFDRSRDRIERPHPPVVARPLTQVGLRNIVVAATYVVGSHFRGYRCLPTDFNASMSACMRVLR